MHGDRKDVADGTGLRDGLQFRLRCFGEAHDGRGQRCFLVIGGPIKSVMQKVLERSGRGIFA